jgi:hypothetical protein
MPDKKTEGRAEETPTIRFPESVLAPPVWVRRAILAMTIVAVAAIGVLFVAIWPYQEITTELIGYLHSDFKCLLSQKVFLHPEITAACLALLIATWGVAKLHVASSQEAKDYSLSVVTLGVVGALILVSIHSAVVLLEGFREVTRMNSHACKIEALASSVLVVVFPVSIASIIIVAGTGRYFIRLCRRFGWLLQIGLLGILTAGTEWLFLLCPPRDLSSLGKAALGVAIPLVLVIATVVVIGARDIIISRHKKARSPRPSLRRV